MRWRRHSCLPRDDVLVGPNPIGVGPRFTACRGRQGCLPTRIGIGLVMPPHWTFPRFLLVLHAVSSTNEQRYMPISVETTALHRHLCRPSYHRARRGPFRVTRKANIG